MCFEFSVRSQGFVEMALLNQFRVRSAYHVVLGKQDRQIAVLQSACMAQRVGSRGTDVHSISNFTCCLWDSSGESSDHD